MNENEMFFGAYIGLKDTNGVELHCGDRVTILEEYTEYDYNNPILNFDTGDVSLREIRKQREVHGVIRYETCWLGFAFIPDKYPSHINSKDVFRPKPTPAYYTSRSQINSMKDSPQFECPHVSYERKLLCSYEFKKIFKDDEANEIP